MIPPSFADLGKAARDLMDKEFPLGVIKFENKGKTPYNIDMNLSGSHNLESGRFAGQVESKYKCSEHGVTLTEKWKSNNTLIAELVVEDKLRKGLKNTLELQFEPSSKKKSGKINTSYKQEYVNVGLDLDVSSLKPNIDSSVVLGCDKSRGYVAGVQASYDSSSQSLTKYQAALGYIQNDLSMHLGTVNNSDYTLSAFQKVKPFLDLGVMIKYARTSHISTFALCSKYKIDGDTFVKTKVDNDSLIHVAYGFNVSQNAKLVLAGQLDGKDFNAGKHRFGMSLDFEA